MHMQSQSSILRPSQAWTGRAQTPCLRVPRGLATRQRSVKTGVFWNWTVLEDGGLVGWAAEEHEPNALVAGLLQHPSLSTVSFFLGSTAQHIA